MSDEIKVVKARSKIHVLRIDPAVMDDMRAIAKKENRLISNQVEVALIKYAKDYDRKNSKETPQG